MVDKSQIDEVEFDLESKIHAVQTRDIYSSFIPAFIGAILGAVLLSAMQWAVIPHNTIVIWLSTFIVITAFRSLLLFYFSKKVRSDEECEQWAKWFFYSTSIASLIWCIAIILFFPENNIEYQLTLAIVIVGMCAGAISTLSVAIESLRVFIYPIMFVLIILFLSQDTLITYLISLGLFIIVSFVHRGANHLNTINKQNIRLRLEAGYREKDLIKAKEDAELANATRVDFFSNMSHELRTPLHGILAFSELGIDKVSNVDQPKIYKYFNQISNSAYRLKTLLDDLLDLRKIDSGKIVLDLDSVDIHNIIQHCVDEQEALLLSSNLTITINLPQPAFNIICDKNRIGQVIMNLLSNAIKFSPENGSILISGVLSSSGDTNNQTNDIFTFCISDEGMGVPKEERELIFNKFIQSSLNVSSVEGTGLGLSVSCGLIKLHHGNIWCESNDKDGASFCFSLPVKGVEVDDVI